MAMTIISNTILKPFTPPSAQSTHTPYPKVPLTIFDKAALDVYVSKIHVFKPPMPSNEILKESLSKALTYFPHFAGRFTVDEQGHQCILLNDAGIRLIETYAPAATADFDPCKDLSHLYPPDELLQIQHNRYACGGLVLATTIQHRVADGQSCSFFLVSWARLARGFNISMLPNHERAGIFVLRTPPRVEFNHRSVEFEKNTPVLDSPVIVHFIKKIVTNFSTDFTDRLKSMISKENVAPDQKFTTFICLLTHVWKKVTQARGLELDQLIKLRIAVNGRRRTNPPIPLEYFGNMVLFAYPKLTVREVLQKSYGYVAKVIHDAVAKVDGEYFQSFIDFGQLCKSNGEELEGTETGNVICPNMEVDSLLAFNFHNLDFGSGPCERFLLDLPIEGVVVFLPSKDQGDGIEMTVSLLPEHAKVFKEISHSLESLKLRSFY